MSRPREEFVSINADVVCFTDKAILVDFQGEEVWLPLSQIETFDANSSPNRVTMTAWIAKQKGII
jgi:hypothetical protein